MRRLILFVLSLLVSCAAWADGFSVVGGKVMLTKTQPVTSEFRLRCVNKAHYDVKEPVWFVDSGANCVRFAVDLTKPEAGQWAALQSNVMGNGMVPIVGSWIGTCNGDPAVLTSIVDKWVAQAATWTQLNSIGMINPANEWGPAATTSVAVPYKPNISVPNYTWRDAYISQIPRLRAAGYTGTIVVDSGSCGQSATLIIRDGADVLAADPLHNLLFDVHIYGGFSYPATASWQADFAGSMAALKATGLPIALLEYGPGRNIGPSPTLIPPEVVIDLAEANGWGHGAWALDDGACTGATDYGFNMKWTCFGDAAHQGDANYTTFGMTVVTKLRALKAASAP